MLCAREARADDVGGASESARLQAEASATCAVPPADTPPPALGFPVSAELKAAAARYPELRDEFELFTHCTRVDSSCKARPLRNGAEELREDVSVVFAPFRSPEGTKLTERVRLVEFTTEESYKDIHSVSSVLTRKGLARERIDIVLVKEESTDSLRDFHEAAERVTEDELVVADFERLQQEKVANALEELREHFAQDKKAPTDIASLERYRDVALTRAKIWTANLCRLRQFAARNRLAEGRASTIRAAGVVSGVAPGGAVAGVSGVTGNVGAPSLTSTSTATSAVTAVWVDPATRARALAGAMRDAEALEILESYAAGKGSAVPGVAEAESAPNGEDPEVSLFRRVHHKVRQVEMTGVFAKTVLD